jgi:hypothetical protein
VRAKHKNRANTKEKQKKGERYFKNLFLSFTSSQALSFTFTHNLQEVKLFECKELKETPTNLTWRA